MMANYYLFGWITVGICFLHFASGSSPCNARLYREAESPVCVCNSSYCDGIDPVGGVMVGQAVVLTSSQTGLRMEKTYLDITMPVGNFTSDMDLITVQVDTKLQKIMGFGGCFTDTTILNLNTTSDATENHFIRSYFDTTGLQYSLGRIPMASTDFADHIYSYDDAPGDFALNHFSLSEEDLEYKIPLIKKANDLLSKPLNLFISPWSAPAWMKTSGKMQGPGLLPGKAGNNYHKTWANYFVKTLEAYKSANIPIWGLTIENEPSAGFVANYSFQAMGFNGSTERDFIKTDLGPALAAGGFGDLKMMICDDQRFFLPRFADLVLNDPEAAKYVSGVAVHWYGDLYSPIQDLDYTHENHPNYFILNTEATSGALPWEKSGVVLGSWTRAESYAKDIIDDINHWVTGWLDWNLAVDLEGGPSWVGNRADAQIVINTTEGADEFYKQPTYYAMAHFSKYVRPDAHRLAQTLVSQPNKTIFNELKASTFISDDGETRISVLLNRDSVAHKVRIAESSGSTEFDLTMEPKSIKTVFWKQ